MEKLKLKMLTLGTTELLTREQMKNLFGGENGSDAGDVHECFSEIIGCKFIEVGVGPTDGTCDVSSQGFCMCTDGYAFAASHDCVRN